MLKKRIKEICVKLERIRELHDRTGFALRLSKPDAKQEANFLDERNTIEEAQKLIEDLGKDKIALQYSVWITRHRLYKSMASNETKLYGYTKDSLTKRRADHWEKCAESAKQKAEALKSTLQQESGENG